MERERQRSLEEGEGEEGVPWLCQVIGLHLHPTHGEFGGLKFPLIRRNWRDGVFVSERMHECVSCVRACLPYGMTHLHRCQPL